MLPSTEGDPAARLPEPQPDRIDAIDFCNRFDHKTEFLAHGDHHAVLAQHLAGDRPQLFRVGVFDHELHENPAETMALEIGANEDGELTVLMVGIHMQVYRTQHFSASRVNRDECYGTTVVELREAGDKGPRDVL